MPGCQRAVGIVSQRSREGRFRGGAKMKQFATYFTHGVRHGAQLRAAIYHTQEAAAILDLVDEFFQAEPALAQ
jgi:hypothetical protein